MTGGRPRPTWSRWTGKPGVLMTVLKAGSISTLDIIDGVKGLLPQVSQIVPTGRS